MLFAATIAINAFLLFLLEPMFAKMALPHFGGSAAVWTTCVLFFQVALVAGYLYAHALSRFSKVRDQVGVHALLLIAGAFTLPIAIPAAWSPPVGVRPEYALLWVLFRRIGIVFVLLSAGSPLLQHWAARRRRYEGKDPFSLYAASNVGSFVALVAYPFVIEPRWTLRGQAAGWAVAYVALFALLVACGYRGMRWGTASDVSETEADDAVSTLGDRLRWILLSAAPSSLLLGVTTHISTDLAAIPLLWVMPLALYLATFVIAFSETGRTSAARVGLVVPYVAIAVASLLFLRSELPGRAGYAIHAIAFFLVALACHRRLAGLRPSSARLTEFYLWIAIGGALGAAFNVVVAPNMFRTVVEYPLAIVAAVGIGLASKGERRWTWVDFAVPATLALGLWGFLSSPVLASRLSERLASFVAVSAAALIAFSARRHSARFALSLAALLLVGHLVGDRNATARFRARSFYGVYAVVDDSVAGMRELFSGTTIHGAELFVDRGSTPLTYYHRDGPLGVLFSVASLRDRIARVGVIGLGVGSTVAYARPGEQWTFYEIDPLVTRIASDTNYFRFLSSASVRPRIVQGDARLSISRERSSAFDLLLVDAFSSDAIPLHLITREALALYRQHLSANGIIGWHVSNRYLDLRPVLSALAKDAGFATFVVRDGGVQKGDRTRFPAVWLFMTASQTTARLLLDDGRWSSFVDGSVGPLWTDDFSNLLSVLH